MKADFIMPCISRDSFGSTSRHKLKEIVSNSSSMPLFHVEKTMAKNNGYIIGETETGKKVCVAFPFKQ